MKRRFWRIAWVSAPVLLAVLAFCGYRVIWGKPFTINMLANRQALEFLIRNPELFTEVGITRLRGGRAQDPRAAREGARVTRCLLRTAARW